MFLISICWQKSVTTPDLHVSWFPGGLLETSVPERICRVLSRVDQLARQVSLQNAGQQKQTDN